MAVSKKDLARVSLGRKRQEKIKVMALTKWKAKVPVGTTIYNHGQEKPAIEYTDKDIIPAVAGMRSADAKLFRHGFRRQGDNFSDYADTPVISEPKAPLPKVVTPRADSPFKKDKRTPVIVRK